MATAIFTLLHDGGKIVSILSQLGALEGMQFISTKLPIAPGQSPQAPLTLVSMGPNNPQRLLPLLHNGLISKALSFDEWWKEEIIYRDDPHTLTRSRLVFSLRHQDGGGHVGELTDPGYIQLKAGANGFVIKNHAGALVPVPGAMAATMCQVAWETMKVLDEKFGALPKW